MLYTATLTVFRYSAWQPTDVNSTSRKHVESLYYSYLVGAEAFAGGGKQIRMVVNETSVSAYAIYGRDGRRRRRDWRASLRST